MTFLKFYSSFVKIFSKSQKKEIYILLFLSLIAMMLETLGIASIFPLLEYIFQGSSNFERYSFFKNNFDLKGERIIYFFIGAFILIFLIKAIYLTYFTYKKNKFVYDIRTFQTNNLFKSYLYKDYLFFIKNNSANLIRNLNDATLLSVFGRSLVELFAEIIMFIGIIIFLIILSPTATISLTLFFGLVGTIFFIMVQSKASKWGEESKYYRGTKIKNMKESFGAIKDIKIMGKELNFVNNFSLNNTQENYFNKKHAFVVNLPRIWFEWLAVLALIFVVNFLTQKVEDNSNIIPIMGVFALAAYRIIPSITRIGNYLQEMKFCLPAVEPYMNDGSHFHPIKKDLNGKRLNSKFKFRNKISIKNLSYKFPEAERYILDDLNVEILKGQFIGIHGESGSGKTTLINIILGLLKPTNGNIAVDDSDISNDTKNWQKLISYIPQNVFITDDKILNNVALGDKEEKIDFDKIDKSLKTSKIFDFVNSLPKGVNTNCGELGEKLSGGQRQRIGISRALYRNSEVLIFDEFTNFLDFTNEKKILNEIKEIDDKTRIIVSHNYEVLNNCDVVYELKNLKLKKSNLKIDEN